jgi:signal transduction histidine kinase
VLVAMVSTLSLSFLVFQLIAAQVERLQINPIYDKLDELQLESARDAFQDGGVPALRSYLARLDDLFGGAHYLLNGKGDDALTGQSEAAMLPAPPATFWRLRRQGRWLVALKSSDGRYWFAAEGQLGRPQIAAFLPYYFLVIGATGLLCWLASIGVISPIRRIAVTIAHFGQGDLAARVPINRTDEIGQLGRSFNQMAERLQRLIASERRLLGDISHEVRSPLARLKFAVKLARTAPDPHAALDRIERDVDRITALVADIVEITFIEGDPTVQDVALVRLAAITDEVVRDCALEAQFRGCGINVGGALAGRVLGNRELLRRAVENVVRNAIRYAPQGSEIHIELREDAREASIVVRDFGPGVPEDTLTRIFDPFFRVEEARDTNGGGSGMGLSIAKRAVQLHHGCIRAENAAPGLRVRIVIPLANHSGMESA